ncbi:MAG: 23S rRNA (guanosine(2251)-2'-O)-methyltransferase RlmB [Candidatus Eremiobacteraeota bacterium]|nr:23S rRNA (guanosine(2251)-2'-O)-methyltransferase RlmB [Candidatus Eremiobacteraeota bacterium]
MHRRARLNFDDVIYGIHAIEEALGAGEALRVIHVAADRKKDAMLRALLARAKELGIPVRFEQRAFFKQLPLRAHQGVIAIAPPFAYRSLHEVLKETRGDGARLFVILDHLTDPHNVGAIVRTAEAAGANALVLPNRRSAGINATVRKAAAGAAAHLAIARVPNVAEAIRTMKKAGVWIAGADFSPGAVALADAELTGDVALVIGAEGTGLSQLTKRDCDYLVRIPMHGKVASLNASVAAGILMYEVVRRRAAGPPADRGAAGRARP